MKVKDLIKRLEENYDQEDEIVYDLWTTDDIQGYGGDITLTEEDANKILKSINNDKDANVGINWDVVESHIDHFISCKRRKRK